MGCASSSPLINGGGPGGIVETVKETAGKTATEVLQAGETAIHDVGDHVKGAVQSVTNEIGNVLGGGKKDLSDRINENDLPKINGHDSDGTDYKIIPLKDPNQGVVDENLENIKNNLLKKAQSFGDDADQMADDIIKETEDLIRDAETGIADCGTEITTRITSLEDGSIEILNLEGEPEIERILENEPKCPPTPEATMNSLLSSEDTTTESETVDSATTVVEMQSQENDSKREA
ncbi:uncharacterized protein LOC131690780 [Topomyia yanbarensis]|uniref:uncharacterized protein LOC131690780 n=1 Tax=Topomyia yanbarensis TaxID=2498891 RepID=UPI00273B786B|nr:uncharacterized protein LOC131690780 [Topomyia yanbarensis]